MLVYLLCRHLEEERLKTAATIRRARTPTNFPLEVMLKIAKHGKGENIYLVRFHYVPPPKAKRSGVKSKSRVAKT
jgi:hypothetical protein